MAVNDIYRVTFNFTTNNRPWQFTIHVKETVASSDQNRADIVAEACAVHFQNELVACFRSETLFQSVYACRLVPSENLAGNWVIRGAQSAIAGDSLPNDNAWVINLRQDTGAAKYNGRIFLSGLYDGAIDKNELSITFFNTQAFPLAQRFSVDIQAVSPESGTWSVVVLSKAYTPAQTGYGTPLEVTSSVARKRIFTMGSRRSKNKGVSFGLIGTGP